jgi:hypothetical protein
MVLLVIGLVAVIVVVLIAVFLSIRLGRGDEDDEPGLRSAGRDRHRDQDERWREPDNRRVAPSTRSAGRGGTARGRGEYDGYASRGPARERDSRGRDGAPHRPARPDSPGYRQQPRPAVAASAAARGRYDTGAPRRHADDFPSADYPSMDFGPGADHPSGEFAVAGYDGTNGRRDRAEPRRKADTGPPAGKSRPRQRGKRDDDDDWPSTEWDRLSDEQYWAELSADKPLSSMARPAKPASAPAASAPVNGSAKAPARETRPAGRPVPDRGLPSREERRDQREPVTERLPVRATGHPRQAQPPAPLPPARRDADLAASRSYPEPHALQDTGPHVTRDTGPYPRRDTGPHPVRDTGPQPRADHRRDGTGPHVSRERDPAMLTGPGSTLPPIPGALEDDPLTSPSFSLKAVPAKDSRSYGNARKHARTTGPDAAPAAARTNGNGHGRSPDGSGSYPVADYADPGYAYQAAPPAAVPPQAPAVEWYSAPPAEAPAPAYGNPYQYTGPSNGNGGSAARLPDSQATAAYPGYLADPLRVYTPPGYETQAPYAEPTAPDAYQPAPLAVAGTMPYADGYQGNPYPDQAGYQDGYHADRQVPGYDQGYRADPYAAGGYSPYPPQG